MSVFSILAIDLLFGIFMLDGLTPISQPNLVEILVINIPTYLLVALLRYFKVVFINNNIILILLLLIKNISIILYYCYV